MPKTRAKRPVRKRSRGTTPPVSASGPRKLKQPEYKSFRLHRKLKPVLPPIAGSFRIFWRSLIILKRYWLVFVGIGIVYAIFNLLLVHGLASNGQLTDIKSILQTTVKGSAGTFANGLALFAYLLGGSSSASSSNADAGLYQTLLLIITSLAFIWALRQSYNNVSVRVRDGFYKGMYPLIPFIVVLFVIGLQLLPIIIGGYIYSTVVSNGIAVGTFEHVLWIAFFAGLALLSLYMICSSVFALYIVTLPDMAPMQALRSARELVRYRRWIIARKILFLPVAVIVLAAIIMVPAIIFLTGIAEWIYFLLTIVGIAVINSYMYILYRELLPREHNEQN